jgi:hypothetical protein
MNKSGEDRPASFNETRGLQRTIAREFLDPVTELIKDNLQCWTTIYCLSLCHAPVSG